LPRRKPDKIIEERRSLGSYERQLEQDKITVEGLKAVSTAVAGIASGLGGLGIGGGLLMAGLLFQKDLKELKDNIVEMWPEGGAFLSSEWISKWGDNPLDIIEEDVVQPDNNTVNELPVLGLSGKAPYEVYTITNAGHWAAYNHALSSVLTDASALVHGAHGSTQQIAPTDPLAVRLFAAWHTINKQPSRFLLLNEFSHQMGIRYTAANQWYNRFLWNRLFNVGRFDPRNDTTWINDKVLDWATCATYPVIINTWESGSQAWSANPYFYHKKRFGKGEASIEKWAFWVDTKPHGFVNIGEGPLALNLIPM
jgi:hypothetical protein